MTVNHCTCALGQWVSRGLLWVGVLLLSCQPVVAESMLEREAVRSYLLEISRQHDLDQHRLAALFVDLDTNEKVLELISRPAEKRLTWPEYRAIFLGEERIQAGRRFLAEHAQTLRAAEQRFGVPPAIVAAIIGVETFYGKFTGGFRVLDALATLAFDHPPRSTFFTAELTEFLRLGTREGWELGEVQGSYAGAMGLPQFISSSYRRYAVDFNEDGQINLFDSIPDVIGSVANYLAEHAWIAGDVTAELWSDPPSDAASWDQGRLKPAVAAADVEAAGFRSDAIRAARSAGRDVSVLQFANGSGEDTLIGYNNFYAITRYNHSRLYARAVLTLAQALDPQQR